MKNAKSSIASGIFSKPDSIVEEIKTKINTELEFLHGGQGLEA